MHLTELIFGFFACTWAFSGALSLSPFAFLKTSPPTRAFGESTTGGRSRLQYTSRWNRWLYHGFHSLDFPSCITNVRCGT